MADEESCSDIGWDLIPGYRPYIADVSISSKSTPFPNQNQPVLTEEEIEKKKKKLKKYIHSKSFKPPISLSDFCIIATERWNTDEEEKANDEQQCDTNCLLI